MMLFCSLLLAPQTDEQKQLNKIVTDFAIKFYVAYENGDVDALMPLTLTPWYHDGQSVIRSPEALRTELKKFLDQRDTSGGKRVPDVKLVAGFASMKDRMATKDREMLQQVAQDDDYVVLVMLKPVDAGNKKVENVVLLVRRTGGKAVAIGVKHTP
ncbi:MAG TPA: hypothetical protein PLN21_17445 [Gemmatales bacterium]|nr:hypothetical protein [Gemmatales bacterium]